MQFIRDHARRIAGATLLAFASLTLTVPAAQAGMVGTEQALAGAAAAEARKRYFAGAGVLTLTSALPKAKSSTPCTNTRTWQSPSISAGSGNSARQTPLTQCVSTAATRASLARR